jgi:hypothetical protein
MVNIAGNAIQIVTQATAQIPFTVTQNNSIWPNIDGLYNAPYRDAKGNWVRLGSTVSLLAQYTSFGDLNNDGFDDAAVIVNKPAADGNPRYFLAAMLNQGGIMFDIAELPLGKKININSHRVTSGQIIIDGKRYELWGNKIIFRGSSSGTFPR